MDGIIKKEIEETVKEYNDKIKKIENEIKILKNMIANGEDEIRELGWEKTEKIKLLLNYKKDDAKSCQNCEYGHGNFSCYISKHAIDIHPLAKCDHFRKFQEETGEN